MKLSIHWQLALDPSKPLRQLAEGSKSPSGDLGERDQVVTYEVRI